MPTRRVLKSVAHDVLDELISRNDDLGGYWVVGQLVAHALANRVSALAVDLICGQSTPSLAGSRLSTLPSLWSTYFWQNIERQRLQRASVARAQAEFSVDLPQPRPSVRGVGDEYRVSGRLEIQDDRGKVYSRTTELWASAHDSRHELKSMRGA